MPDFFERNRAWAKPGPYATKLSPEQERQFFQWVGENKGRLGQANFNDPKSDYDMRGWWLANGGVAAPQGHFPDTFKTPYHETFSNESQYALPTAPRWVQVDNSFALVTPDNKILFREPMK